MVKDPKGNPRLFTSASSFGRMVTKLHFLIDPKTHDIVRPAAFAENIINVELVHGQAVDEDEQADLDVQDPGQPIANAVIGHLAGGVHEHLQHGGANGKDSVMGNVIADAQKADPTIVRNGVKPVSRS